MHMSLPVRLHTANITVHHRMRFAGAAMLTLLALVAIGLNNGCQKVPLRSSNLIVRGYIIAAAAFDKPVGADVRGAVVNPRSKEVYLPGVTVYLQDAGSRKNSRVVKTDLSGRFTLYAPRLGRYHLCWKSEVYGAGCDP